MRAGIRIRVSPRGIKSVEESSRRRAVGRGIESVEVMTIGHLTIAVASRVDGQAFLMTARHASVPGISGKLRQRTRTSAEKRANGRKSATRI